MKSLGRFRILAVMAAGAVAVCAAVLGVWWWGAVVVGGILVGVAGVSGERPTVKVGKLMDGEGRPRVFTLTLGGETITLDPGKAWVKTDLYKWVTRGLMEEPQSYHVHPNGMVEVNGEKITLEEEEGTSRLEHEMNKRYALATDAHKAPVGAQHAAAPVRSRWPADRVHFHVKLDHMGHLMVECQRGEEKSETGLRGLPTLILNGLMLPPERLHVDPLQRAVEVDGQRFECDEAGARGLEELLNSRYAAKLKRSGDHLIEIKENPASATGFDIHFTTFHAGARLEVKGHLTQERLDFLQDSSKCDLLEHGILLRLSPPNLLIRRRRPDGGEERVPEVPDIPYRRVTAAQLQQVFNNPRIRRAGSLDAEAVAASVPEHAHELREIRLVRSPQYPVGLWLECVSARSGKVEGMALTHHNIAELLLRGVFHPRLDVTLSLDNRVLTILHEETHEEQKFEVGIESADDILARAGRALTAALKPVPEPPPPAPAAAGPKRSAEEGAGAERPLEPVDMGWVKEVTRPPPPASAPPPSAPAPAPPQVLPRPLASPPPPAPAVARAPTVAERPAPSPILRWPYPIEPNQVNLDVFWRLVRRVNLEVQEVHLSLPRVFEDRRFDVLSFGGQEIETLADLRSPEFYGFYLSHVDDRHVILVYACQGRHIEWGSLKCVVQPSVTAEAEEHAGGALRGLAQDANGSFVFVVTPEYRSWIQSREREYLAACARFLGMAEFLADRGELSPIWPEVQGMRPAAPPG